MGWPKCNSTLEDMTIDETNLFDNHTFAFHDATIAASAVFGAIAIVISLLLMFMHSTHYSRPREQRHIIRILFMVPVYALVSFLSIVFYTHSVYYEVLRDCYEAFAIASFFSLMCSYIADDLHHQKEYFRTITPKKWIWPMKYFQKCAGGEHGWLRTPRSGLTWFNVIWVAVFQYCFIRVSMTITAVISQYYDRYCLESLNPAFSHVWVMVIEAIAVSVTMYCIIQFYVQIRKDIAQHKPVLKVLAIKLVIFLSFWQTILISLLTSSGAIKANQKIATPDIKVGIPSMLLCIEMAIFAVFHWWSFSYKPYVIGSKQYQDIYSQKDNDLPKYHGGPLGIKAALDCFNPWDLIKATGRSAKWLFVTRKRRTEDPSYASVTNAQKMNDLNATTAYGAGSTTNLPLKGPTNVAEGSGLLVSDRPPPPQNLNPYVTRESDSSSTSPWAEVEAKEYFQDQETRRKDPRRDDFPPAQSQPTAYDMKYSETQYHPPTAQQQMGVVRPAGTGPDAAGRNPQLPFVTRRDIEDIQQGRGQAPYPRSMASVNVSGGGNTANMPSMQGRNQDQRNDGFI